MKTAAWVEWFDGTHVDARLVILLCLAMIEKAEKEKTAELCKLEKWKSAIAGWKE